MRVPGLKRTYSITVLHGCLARDVMQGGYGLKSSSGASALVGSVGPLVQQVHTGCKKLFYSIVLHH